MSWAQTAIIPTNSAIDASAAASSTKTFNMPASHVRTYEEQCSSYVPYLGEAGMLKVFVEEAAALASIALFVGMIAVWAQLIPQL